MIPYYDRVKIAKVDDHHVEIAANFHKNPLSKSIVNEDHCTGSTIHSPATAAPSSQARIYTGFVPVFVMTIVFTESVIPVIDELVVVTE